jgi:hypothetical protein
MMILITVGDSLHQVFDCIMMGPYSKMNFWTNGHSQKLGVPDWARDADGVGHSCKETRCLHLHVVVTQDDL